MTAQPQRRVRTRALRGSRAVGVLLAVALPITLASCGGSPSAKKGSSTTTSTPKTPTTQTMTVSPSRGLKSGETVTVRAAGFSPNQSLVLTECANKGKATGPGDCDLNNLKSVKSNASGDVRATYSVTKGPFGGSKIKCDTPTACILSVTQATENPSQDATAVIAFG